MISTIECLKQLVAYPSVTPNDAGCQAFMIDVLKTLGFDCQIFNRPPVSNFFASIGHQGPLLVFAGHTDVVPPGQSSEWLTNPFTLTERDTRLFGRGTADMKGSLACMMSAAHQFITTHPNPSGRLGFLITSGEEGDDFNLGTPYVMSQLKKLGIQIDFCIVGEPSAQKTTGDTIRIGRRGSLTGQLTLQGKQGHVAYPDLAVNPIHTISPALTELTTYRWDEGDEFFPPTSLQITHIHSGGDAGNVIPGALMLEFNIRYAPKQTEESLKATVHACFEKYHLKPNITWRLNGMPFLTSQGRLLASCIEAIESKTGQTPILSTGGGTSDGRFIAPFDVEVIELGPVNQTIHQVNEYTTINDLTTLTELYYAICKKLLT